MTDLTQLLESTLHREKILFVRFDEQTLYAVSICYGLSVYTTLQGTYLNSEFTTGSK